MMIIILVFLLSGLFKQVSSIQCYTCSQLGHHCSLPFNLDAGDESNENDIETFNYDPGFVCQSDHSFNPSTGEEKLILRGTEHCKEINIPNHRVHCCYTNNCNKQLPPMTVLTLADTSKNDNSSSIYFLPSYILILFLISFLFYFKIY